MNSISNECAAALESTSLFNVYIHACKYVEEAEREKRK
jgi:hypothetical protein